MPPYQESDNLQWIFSDWLGMREITLSHENEGIQQNQENNHFIGDIHKIPGIERPDSMLI